MIELTKMNNEKVFINPYLVEIVETTPDTLITTMSGKKYYVLETPQEFGELCIEYFVKINKRSYKGKRR